MSKFCPNCGTQMDDEQSFCTSCGTNVSAAKAANEPQQPATYQEAPVYSEPAMPPIPPKKSKKGLIIIISVIVAVLIAAAAAFYFLDPFELFGNSKDKDKDKTSSSDIEGDPYESLVSAFKNMGNMSGEDLESILVDFNLKAKADGQSVKMAGQLDVLAPDSEDGAPIVYGELSASANGESRDMEMLVYDGMQYMYSDGEAQITPADSSGSDAGTIEGIEELMELLENADSLSFEDVFGDEDIDDEGLEDAEIDVLKLLKSKIKMSKSGNDNVYSIDIDVRDLAIELLDEFAKQADDKDSLEEYYDSLDDEMPENADIKLELVLSKEFIKSISFGISVDVVEISGSIDFELNASKLSEGDIQEFIDKCNENVFSDGIYGFEDDFDYGYDYMSKNRYF